MFETKPNWGTNLAAKARTATRWRVGSGINSGRLGLKISIRPPDYFSLFQEELMVICQAAQWFLSLADLLSTSFVNAHFLRGADIDYLALQTL